MLREIISAITDSELKRIRKDLNEMKEEFERKHPSLILDFSINLK